MGLLKAPPQTGNNYRIYQKMDVARLGFIRRARGLGFSIDQIGMLLDLASQRHRSCESVDSIAQKHLGEIDHRIADLTSLRGDLAAIVGACSSGRIANCRILEALTPRGEQRMA